MEASLIERFQGDAGKRFRIEALLRQPVVQGQQAIADAIDSVCEVQEYQTGDAVIVQGASDNDLFFIISGEVEIVVNGRAVARRKVGQHVGEMAFIDTSIRRSATVVAMTPTIAIKVTEPNFAEIANEHPAIWRRLAVELVVRLGQRGAALKPPNQVPHVFIGSSAESLRYAETIQTGLYREKCVAEVWTQNVFEASAGTLEALEEKAANSDFAVLVLCPDDLAIVRGQEHVVPRDNVIFELGLFMGALGRNRTYMVVPHNRPTKLPSDLLGITPLTYQDGGENLAAILGPVCTALKSSIRTLGSK